jgi:hypothetical protein
MELSNTETAVTFLAHQRAQNPESTSTQSNALSHQDILAAFPSIDLPIDDTDPRDKQTERRYLTQDTNPATHLIRNAMSNGNGDQRSVAGDAIVETWDENL